MTTDWKPEKNITSPFDDGVQFTDDELKTLSWTY